MSRNTQLAKNTAILAFGRICTQCISFFMLPLYTAVLDTTEYGMFDLMITYGTLLLPAIGWQFDQGIFRFMLECRNDKEQQSRLFSTVLVSQFLQVAGYILLFLLALLIFDIPHAGFLMAYVALHVFTALLLQVARGLGKNGVYAFASFLSASSTVTLNVLFLVVLPAIFPVQFKLQGLFWATSLAQIFTIIYLCIAIKPHRYFRFRYIKKDVFKSVCSYSVPLIPNSLSWWVVNTSNHAIVSAVLTVAVNGIYTVANKFSHLFIQLFNVFNLSWTETVALHFNDEDRDEFLSKTLTTVYNLFACACFGIVACIPFIFPIMVDADYADAYPHIIILMYAMLLRVVVGLYSTIYVATKDSKKLASTSIIAAVVNIVINIALITKIGLYAASVSTLIAFGSMAILRYIDINRILRLRIHPVSLFSSLAVGGTLTVTYYLNNTLINIIMLAAVVVYSLVINWKFICSSGNLVRKVTSKFLKK